MTRLVFDDLKRRQRAPVFFVLALVALLGVACSPQRAPVLELTPTALLFEPEEVSQTLLLRNTGDAGSALDWTTAVSYQGEASAWLSVEPERGSTAGGQTSTLTVAVDRSSLAPGSYQATVTVSSNGGTRGVAVTMNVARPATLEMVSSDLAFEPEEVSKTLLLRNDGDASSVLDWTTAVSYQGEASPWLSLTPASGRTAGGEASTLTLAVDRSELAPGLYSATLTVSSNGGASSVAVSLQVPAPPEAQLGPLPEQIAFAADEASILLTIQNTGSPNSALLWELTVGYQGEASGWLDVTPMSGTTPGDDRRTATLNVSREGLAPGEYQATLTVSTNAGNASIPVVVNVAPPEPQAVLTVSAPEISFGESASERTLTVSNSGEPGSSLQWSATVSYTEDTPDWLGVEPLSGALAQGEAQSLALSASREGLAPGSYGARLTVSSDGGTSAVPVSLTVSAPPAEIGFRLEPDALELGAGSEDSFAIVNSSAVPLAWTASASESWLTLVNPSSQARGAPLEPGASDAVQVIVSRAGLAPGTHSATVTVRAQDASDASRQQTRTLNVRIEVTDTAPPASSSVAGRVTTPNSLISITTAAEGELSAQSAQPLMSAAARGPAYVPGELLVRYRTDAAHAPASEALYQQSLRSLAADYGLRVLRTGNPAQPDLVALPPGADAEAAARALEADPRVLYASPNYYVYTQNLPNDPRIQEQWALPASGLPTAWGRETGTSSRVVVAVIDTGFDLNHPDLAGRYLPGYDFCANQGCSRTDNDPSFGQSQNFHGTHVAGIIAAAGNNNVGVTGAAYGNNVRILPLKVFPNDGSSAPIGAIIDAINWAVGLPVTTVDNKTVTNPEANRARVINMSLGGNFDMPFALQEAINNARARGAVITVAAGNNGVRGVQSPAAAAGVLAVGAHNQAFRRSCFSNFGQPDRNSFGPGGLDLLAPGGDMFAGCTVSSQGLLSTVPNSLYAEAVGTSMAAPMVASVAALLLSREPNLSASQIESRITGAAYFDASYMNANHYGAGILRADRALGLAGPGDSVSVVAEGPSAAQASVTLDLFGSSSSFTLRNLSAGTYTLRAGDPGALYGERQVTLQPAQALENQTVGLLATP